MVAKGERAAKLHFLRLPMVRVNSGQADKQTVYMTAVVACRKSDVRDTVDGARSALRFNEQRRAVKQWAFPGIDPHTLNDMEINYTQGSRQPELATVDGAEKRSGGGGRGSAGQRSQCHRGIVS